MGLVQSASVWSDLVLISLVLVWFWLGPRWFASVQSDSVRFGLVLSSVVHCGLVRLDSLRKRVSADPDWV